MTDSKLPKWFKKEMLPFYDAQPGTDWAVAGLTEQKLANPDGPPIIFTNFQGLVLSREAGEKLMCELCDKFNMAKNTTDWVFDRDSTDRLFYVSRNWYSNDAGAVSVTFVQNELSLYASLVTTERALADMVAEFFKEHTKPEATEEYIYAMVQKQSGIKFQRIGKARNAIERANYSADVLGKYDRVVAELNSDNPRGRIALFDGPPGTGKTYLVRALLEDTKGIHVMIPSHMVASLGDPSVLPAIIDLKASEERPIIFVIEDGDEVIAPRSAGNMSAISSVLNLGDGILGACLDIRIVVTTNAKHNEFDEAIIRPGRLIALCHVGKLSKEEANTAFQRITGTNDAPFLAPATLAEVYSHAVDGGFSPVTKTARKVGFGS